MSCRSSSPPRQPSSSRWRRLVSAAVYPGPSLFIELLTANVCAQRVCWVQLVNQRLPGHCKLPGQQMATTPPLPPCTVIAALLVACALGWKLDVLAATCNELQGGPELTGAPS
jgi:hypothetical protein